MSFVCLGVVPSKRGKELWITDNVSAQNMTPAARQFLKDHGRSVDEIEFKIHMGRDAAREDVQYLVMDVNMIEMAAMEKSPMCERGVGTNMLKRCIERLLRDEIVDEYDHNGAYIVFYFENNVASARNYTHFLNDIRHHTRRNAEARVMAVKSADSNEPDQVRVAFFFTEHEVDTWISGVRSDMEIIL